jgi:outer membrane biosynthesis protein TonB
MRALALAGLVALCAACAAPAPPPAPAPDPVPPAAPPERPGIETAAVMPATETAVPVAPAAPAAPQPAAAPATELPPSLTFRQVEKTFAHHRRFFNGAYRDRLLARAGLAGKIVVSFVIQPDGTTRGARKVSSTLNDAPFERAVLDQIDRMTFPLARGVTPVERYPLQFSEQTKR